MVTLHWEQIKGSEDNAGFFDTETVAGEINIMRAKIPRGWLVREFQGHVGAISLTFVPDPKYTWK